jgi:hypothetical protein
MWIALQFIRISFLRAGAYVASQITPPDHVIDKYRRRMKQLTRKQTGHDTNILCSMDDRQMKWSITFPSNVHRCSSNIHPLLVHVTFSARAEETGQVRGDHDAQS